MEEFFGYICKDLSFDGPMTEERLTDELLVARLRERDDAVAFDELFVRYAGRVYAFAMRCLQSESEAEDVVQETFLRVWSSRHALDPKRSIRAYMFAIALNIMRKYFNRRALKLRYLESAAAGEIEAAVLENPGDNIDMEAARRRVEALLEGLPERKREVFLRRRDGGLSSREIAAEFGISSGRVDNIVAEVRRMVRAALHGEV